MLKNEQKQVGKKLYESKCSDRRRVGKLRRKWVNNVHDCMRENSLNEGQAGGIVYDRNS